ncbi:unnamed protein product [Leuciscus chuanchicus]
MGPRAESERGEGENIGEKQEKPKPRCACWEIRFPLCTSLLFVSVLGECKQRRGGNISDCLQETASGMEELPIVPTEAVSAAPEWSSTVRDHSPDVFH